MYDIDPKSIDGSICRIRFEVKSSGDKIKRIAITWQEYRIQLKPITDTAPFSYMRTGGIFHSFCGSDSDPQKKIYSVVFSKNGVCRA